MNDLHARIATTVEAHPALGWVGSALAFILSGLTWLLNHVVGIVSAITPVFVLGGAMFGFAAGYYTFRIQRDAWRRRRAQNRRGLLD